MKQLEKYRREEARLSERLEPTRHHLKELVDKRDRLQQGNEVVMERFNRGDCEMKDVLDSKRKLQSVSDEINEVRSFLASAEQAIRDQLKGLLSGLERELGREVAETSERIQSQADALKRSRAELLILLAKFHDEAINENYAEVANIFQSHGETLRVRNDVPTLNLFFSGAGVDKHVLPTEQEMTRAYKGGFLPDWIRWFAVSGQIVENNLASRLLKEWLEEQKKGQ